MFKTTFVKKTEESASKKKQSDNPLAFETEFKTEMENDLEDISLSDGEQNFCMSSELCMLEQSNCVKGGIFKSDDMVSLSAVAAQCDDLDKFTSKMDAFVHQKFRVDSK